MVRRVLGSIKVAGTDDWCLMDLLLNCILDSIASRQSVGRSVLLKPSNVCMTKQGDQRITLSAYVAVRINNTAAQG